MKPAHHYRADGDDVRFTKRVERQQGEPTYEARLRLGDFAFLADPVVQFRNHLLRTTFPPTAWSSSFLGVDDYEHYDYSVLS